MKIFNYIGRKIRSIWNMFWIILFVSLIGLTLFFYITWFGIIFLCIVFLMIL